MSLSRREFLRSSLGTSSLLALSGVVPSFLHQAALALEPTRGRAGSVLVVIQMSGGNDGLNTVVPYEDDAYHRSRPTLRLTAERVLKLGAGLGFHPELSAFYRLFQAGRLAVVQGVGYANSSREHDAAKQDWHTAAAPADASQTGWLGRVVDRAAAESIATDVPAVFVGSIPAPFSLHAAQNVVPAIRSFGDWLPQPERTSLASAGAEGSTAPAGTSDPLLAFLRQSTAAAATTREKLAAFLAADDSAGSGDYPAFPLARDLRSIGQLVRADLGIRIFFTELGGGGIGGFDTHAGQAANHGSLLRELSESIAAFLADLERDRLLDSLLLMSVSEFGRTLAENGRHGTDHGAAAPLFLAGGRLEGGLVGAHPSLTELDAGAPKFHTDFRRVYATVLERWLGFDSQPILGSAFRPLEGVVS